MYAVCLFYESKSLDYLSHLTLTFYDKIKWRRCFEVIKSQTTHCKLGLEGARILAGALGYRPRKNIFSEGAPAPGRKN